MAFDYLWQGPPASNGPHSTGTAYGLGADTVNNQLYITGTGGIVRANGPLVRINLTAQSAAISGAALYTVPTGEGGIYRVAWAAKVTTAATTSSVLGGTNTGFQVTYTDDDDAVSVTTPLSAAPSAAANQAYSQTNALNTTGAQASGNVIVNAQAGSSITYSFGYTSVGATGMQYAIHVRLFRE